MKSKRDYEDLLIKTISPITNFFSNGNAYIDLGNTSALYREKAKRIEGFARPLWGLAPYYACDSEQKDFKFAELWRMGFVNGANPKSEEYWGEICDYDQVMVEMVAIGLALILSPQEFFYKLSNEARNNLAKWLYQINEYKPVNNNWRLFPVIVNCGLKNVNMPYSQNVIESSFQEIDKWYLGDGWYYDGTPDRIDYYNAFAIHFYSLIYAKFTENENKQRSDELKSRAKEFAKSYIYLFSKSGEAIPFGRSLTYRFAQVSFWSALVWADCSPFSLGVTKGIINRNLEYWFSSKMTDNLNLLTIGYSYPNLLMSDNYNAPASPYWALKALLILALPENHRFFKTDPEPLPLHNEIHPINAIHMLAVNNDFDAILYPHGFNFNYDCCLMAEKYSKFAYSAKFGFNVPRSEYSIDMKAPDSMLAFDIDGIIYVRNRIISYQYNSNSIKTVWSPCFGITVETEIIPDIYSHRRIHKINSNIECSAYDTGFSVPFSEDSSVLETSENTAKISTNGYGCSVSSKYGTPTVINCSPNTNLVFQKIKIPAIKYKINKGTTLLISDIYETIDKR